MTKTDMTAESRFWAKVGKSNHNDCWPWLGTADRKGYGRFWYGGRMLISTHVALILAGRPRPGAALALHSCDNPTCCNAAHLWWGTTQENALDASFKGRLAGQNMTHCKNGHPFDEQNTRVTAKGRRACRECQRTHRRRHAHTEHAKALRNKAQNIRRSINRADLAAKGGAE